MKTKVTKQKKKNKKSNLFFFMLVLLIGLSIIIYSFGQKYFLRSQADLSNIIILQPNPDVPHPNLQLKTFMYITLPAQPQTVQPSVVIPSQTQIQTPQAPPIQTAIGSYCPVDTVLPHGSTCQCTDMNSVACPAPASSVPGGAPSCSGDYPLAMQLPAGLGSWYCVKLVNPGMTNPNPPAPPSGCSNACIAKPVVYLYPTKKTKVNVAVLTPGNIFVSNPLYPQGGWKNVEANPNGDLLYQGQKYKELFYESTVVKKVAMPEKGIIIRTDTLETSLRQITAQLGLIGSEQDEFVAYWVPTLQRLHAPYIYFSILPSKQKDAYDHLDISPKPDTRIEFIAYFKPLQQPMAVTPLELPATPVRKGFTEVEWGGTIGE